jgi:anaerobic ribonucleoside-triphosphate reductase activating protein
VAVDDLAERVSQIDGIEGITFLGGEPFDQAAALAALARNIRAQRLSVMTFTGYQLEMLTSGRRQAWIDLLAATDLLVDGPYDARCPDLVRPWVGSTNQRFHFLTNRYADLAARLNEVPDRLEVRLSSDGTVFINGMARNEQLFALQRQVMGSNG